MILDELQSPAPGAYAPEHTPAEHRRDASRHHPRPCRHLLHPDFTLRSPRLGLTSLVPNLVPGALGFGIWGLTVSLAGLSLSMVTAMTLGIVVDDTVHFLSKYQRARRELGHAAPDAARVAFRTVGGALLTISIVLVAGFVVISLFSFELNLSMGKLTALVIALALFADFFILPPLLMRIDAGGTAPRSTGFSERRGSRR